MSFSEKLLRRLAPCGLHCGKCLAFRDGEIRQAAALLQQKLGPNFPAYAERFAQMNPVFHEYPQFRDLLSFMAQGSCEGCRGTGCILTSCKVGHCVREMNVDFCFECDEFPCTRHNLPPALEARWKENNETMLEQGVQEFYHSIRNAPRYP